MGELSNGRRKKICGSRAVYPKRKQKSGEHITVHEREKKGQMRVKHTIHMMMVDVDRKYRRTKGCRDD